MKATKIHTENRKVKYIYDYPANREVAKHLTAEDKAQIAFRTGYNIKTVHFWCRGQRRSRRIDEWARKIMRLNITKQRKLDVLLKK